MNCNHVHEVFSYMVTRSVRDPNLLNDYLRYFDKLMPIVRLARTVSPVLRSCYPCNDKKFAFYTTRFNHVMEGVDSNSQMLFGKPQELLFSIRNNIPFYPVYDVIPELFHLFHTDPRLESARAAKMIRHVTALLAKMNPEYLVLWNDAMFVERLLVFCGRQVGVRSICIQHGIFHDTFDRRLLDGYYADYMFVWGKSQADLYQGCGFDKGKLRIMGYPYRVENLCCSKNDNVVCLLGENIEIIDKELGAKKRCVYEKIAEFLLDHDYKVVYKPHPFENDKKFLPSNIEILSIGLSKAFDKYNKFIALTSTALLEATLHGKIAVQYLDDDFGGCNFSLKGFSYTTRDMKEIPLYLSKYATPSVIDRDAVFLNDNPAQRFLDTVEALQNGVLS